MAEIIITKDKQGVYYKYPLCGKWKITNNYQKASYYKLQSQLPLVMYNAELTEAVDQLVDAVKNKLIDEAKANVIIRKTKKIINKNLRSIQNLEIQIIQYVKKN